MSANTYFVTLALPSSYARLGGIAVGIVFTFAWITLLGMQTYAMALFALSIVAIFETQKYFNLHGTLEGIAVDKAVGTAYALFIALSVAHTLPYGFVIATLVAVSLFWYFDTKAPSTIGWLRRRLANGFGLTLSTLLAGIAAGLGGALGVTALSRALT